MRVFIDVGAHYGETLDVALNPTWGFDRIHLIEPASACQPLLLQFRDPRITIHPLAIGAKNGNASLYGTGLLGATLFPSKAQKADPRDITTEKVQLVRASEWFRENIPEDAEAFIKFNCEGAECDIIDDLLSCGLGARLTSLYIDFDIRKVQGEAHRQFETEEALRRASVRYSTSETLDQRGNHAVIKWLSSDCSRAPVTFADAWSHRLALYAPAYVRAKLLAQSVLPKPLYFRLGRRFGRLRRSA